MQKKELKKLRNDFQKIKVNWHFAKNKKEKEDVKRQIDHFLIIYDINKYNPHSRHEFYDIDYFIHVMEETLSKIDNNEIKLEE